MAITNPDAWSHNIWCSFFRVRVSSNVFLDLNVLDRRRNQILLFVTNEIFWLVKMLINLSNGKQDLFLCRIWFLVQ